MATNLTPSGGLDVGDRRTITATFLDAAGDPADVDPGDITVTVRPPGGPTEEVDAGDITVASGVVTYEVVFDTAGRWHGRTVWSSAEGSEADEWFANVRRSNVPAPPAP